MIDEIFVTIEQCLTTSSKHPLCILTKTEVFKIDPLKRLRDNALHFRSRSSSKIIAVALESKS